MAVAGQGIGSTVARVAIKGVAGGVVGVVASIAAEVIWHYYGDDILEWVSENTQFGNIYDGILCN